MSSVAGGDASSFETQAQEYAQARADYRTRASNRWHDYQMEYHYKVINEILRGPDNRERRKEVQTWEQVFDRLGMDTPEDLAFYRGLHGAAGRDWLATLTPGSVFVEDGVMSTTSSLHAARGWLTDYFRDEAVPDDAVLVEVRVPKGTRVVGGHTGTIETMLRPGAKVRVLSHERRPSPGDYAGDVHHVTVEVIP